MTDRAPNAGVPQMMRRAVPRTPISRRTENLAPAHRTELRTALRDWIRDRAEGWHAVIEIRDGLPRRFQGKPLGEMASMLRRMRGAEEVERRDTTRQELVDRGLDPRTAHLWRYREAE